ncbi:MAG: universal stress protein [Algiphilus sp.]
MDAYCHVLAAVEVHETDGPRVLHHARDIARRFEAQLSVVHVVEYMPIDPAGDALLATPLDLTQERREQAGERLKQWCEDAQIVTAHTWVTVGSTTQEIIRARDAVEADLIVIGHRSRRGLAALFSSTDDGVLHHAHCDVLAMHLD